jgi:AcrR family transcriptional regulator
VSPRPYRLGRREALVEDTRARIIAATRQLLTGGGLRRLSLDEVARRADVARATVYYQFGSKRGVLEAVVLDVQQRAGQREVDFTVERANPVAALQDVIASGCQFWAAEHEIVRAVSGLAAVDPDISDVLSRADEHRHTLIDQLADRLEHEGALRAGCSRDQAVDILSLLFSFETFDQLFTGRRLPVAEVASVLTTLAVSALCTPAEPDAAFSTR